MWETPPLGVHRLAAWIRKRTDVEVEVYDPSFSGDPEPLFFTGFNFIGFSPLCDGLADQINMMQVAHRENPKAVLIVGGIEATLNYQTILEHTAVTWVVLGDGEKPLEAIVTGKKPHEIAGVLYRSFNKPSSEADVRAYYDALSFADMRFPDYWARTGSLYDRPDWSKIRTVRVSAGTHCNRRCTFCAVSQWHTQAVGAPVKVTLSPAQELIRLVEKIKCEVPDVRSVYFCEDDFCLDRERAFEFFRRSGGYGLTYMIQGRLDNLTLELIRAAGKGKVRSISMGIENGSEKVLRDFAKPQDLSRLPEIIAACIRAEIVPYLLFILFAPSADMADMREHVRAMRAWMDAGATVSMQPVVIPYRGTPLYDSDNDFVYKFEPVGNGIVRRPGMILPKDKKVREVMEQFFSEWPSYKQANAPRHATGGITGALMLSLVERIVSECGSP